MRDSQGRPGDRPVRQGQGQEGRGGAGHPEPRACHPGGRQRGQAPRQARRGPPSRAASSTSSCRCTSRRWRSSARAATSRPGSATSSRTTARRSAFCKKCGADAVSTTSAPARPRLKERYLTEVRDQLKDELGLGNVMEVPRLEKIVINMGVGRATQQASLIEGAQRDLETITGQKPIVTRAKQSIAGFKLPRGPGHRGQGDPAGRPGLGVLRPAAQPGHSPHPRLPRALAPLVRRPRQLHVRGDRAADLPRDRLRQDRHDPRHGHHHRHDRTHQRGRTGVPGSVRLSVPTGEPVAPWRRRL